jgi:hypothetical protein
MNDEKIQNPKSKIQKSVKFQTPKRASGLEVWGVEFP